jgi:DNA-binding HxlR family transcriptional regulator
MTGYGQFCAVARAHDALGGRWTLLVVRELLCGSRRFNDIRRGIPRISRTVLSERLQDLVALGVATRSDGARGPEYALTEAGLELAPVVAALAEWGQRRLPRRAEAEDLEPEPVLVDMARRVRREALPEAPLVVRFALDGSRPRFLLLRRSEASACARNPGFPEPLTVRGPLSALVGWWRGDTDFEGARRRGLTVEGEPALARAFADWFELYLFAGVRPAGEEATEERRAS